MSDDEIRQKWSEIDGNVIDDACKQLRERNRSILGFLSDIVAATCNVDKDAMLSCTDNITIAHARWLYWYAYRYVSNETYDKMAAVFKDDNNAVFKARSITSGVNKMMAMINKEQVWADRWRVIHNAIGLRTDTQQSLDFGKKKAEKIVISIPNELKNKIEIKYIE